MKPVVIMGVGELAQLAHYYFTHDSARRIAGFTVDPQYIAGTEFRSLPLVPFDRLEETFPPDQYDLFVAIGYTGLNSIRAEKCALAKERGYCLASYVSGRASTWPDLEIGENSFVMEGNIIQPFVRIGNNVIVCCSNFIGHHTEIRDNCFVTSEVTVSGGVTIESNCFIGVNATIREHLRIGRNCIIGAGALILRDAPADGGYVAVETKASGIPSHRLKSLL